MAFALYSEAELARLTRVFQDTNAADAQIRQHLSTIASLLKESESKQAHDIVTTFCHIIDVLQDQQEHQVETLTCAIEQARACPIQYVPAPRQEQTRCPYEDPQDMLEEFYRHFVEKKSPSTMNDYVSRIKTFAHSPQYLGDMLESGELGVRELDNDPVMFTYEHIEQILARATDLIPNHITIDDILASINYVNCLGHEIGTVDDIDHLGNRRIRSVGA